MRSVSSRTLARYVRSRLSVVSSGAHPLRGLPSLGTGRVHLSPSVMVNLQTLMRRADVLLDMMGVGVGVMLLVAGVGTYRNGGSVGWAIAGSAVFLINLWVARRHFARRKRPTRAP